MSEQDHNANRKDPIGTGEMRMGQTTILCNQGGTLYILLINRGYNKAAVNNVVSLAPIHFPIFICALQNLLLVISVEIMDILLGCAIRN